MRTRHHQLSLSLPRHLGRRSKDKVRNRLNQRLAIGETGWEAADVGFVGVEDFCGPSEG